MLLAEKVDPEAPVIGYLEYKGSVGVERGTWRFLAAPTYNFQYNLPFAYQGLLDQDLRGIVLSYVSMLGHFDFRDDKLRPHAGLFIQNETQFAGLGGDARDFRIHPDVRGYIPLGSKVTLAARASVGFLMPLNYGDAASAAANRDRGSLDDAAYTRDLQIIYLRGFFSGGPGSNRGYPLRGVGPHGAVFFFDPGLAARDLPRACVHGSEEFDPIRCGVPLGGLSLWEASLELRFLIVDPLGGATFCDASDVALDPFTLRLDHPHLSCGAGLRVDTPVGPVRLDVGYRIPGAQYSSDADPVLEGDPGTVWGLPIAISIGIGESF